MRPYIIQAVHVKHQPNAFSEMHWRKAASSLDYATYDEIKIHQQQPALTYKTENILLTDIVYNTVRDLRKKYRHQRSFSTGL